MNEETRKLIWESLLAADYRYRYFGELAGRFMQRERAITIAVFVFTLGTTAGIFFEWEKLAATLMGAFSAALAVILLVQRYSDRATEAADASTQWAALRLEFESLWTALPSMDDVAASSRWQTLEASHAALDKRVSRDLGYRRRLAKRCWQEMLIARGLPAT